LLCETRKTPVGSEDHAQTTGGRDVGAYQDAILFELLEVDEVPDNFVRGEVVEQTHQAFEQQSVLAIAQSAANRFMKCRSK
jgi:hypothetical protein